MTDENAIDWKQATDEQLAAAAAELKNRRPLTDFENLNWANMNESEFSQNKEEVFSSMRQHAKDRRTDKAHAEKEARAND